MKIEKIIKSLKKDYEGIRPSNEIIKYGWSVLLGEIEAKEQEKYFFRNSSFSRVLKAGIISLTLFLVVGYGLVKASSKATPGQLFYPLKHIAELINTKVSIGVLSKIDNKEEKIEGLLKKKTTTEDSHSSTESSKKEFTEKKQDNQNTDDQKKSKEFLKKEDANQIRSTGNSVKDKKDSDDIIENKSKDQKKETGDSLKNDIESIIKSLQK